MQLVPNVAVSSVIAKSPNTLSVKNFIATVFVVIASMILGLTLPMAMVRATDTLGSNLGDKLTGPLLDRVLADQANGFSTDEVMIRDDLRAGFLKELGQQLNQPIAREQEAEVFLSLLNARKAGKLTYRATKRSPRIDENVDAIAEIAVRAVTDRHRVSMDTLLADAEMREELQHEVTLIAKGIDAYAIRKSVLSLRKKRALRPELVLQVADWQREVMTWSLAELTTKLKADEVPHLPGIYMFRTEAGYLYIGEAVDLSDRLTQHTSGSDRVSLAEHLRTAEQGDVTVELHVFPKDSPAKRVTVRRAYESELIRSRHPKLNVRP
ncbi:hypothetical protein Pla22_38660 [Rubripirellula amarantea]|uniref:GIY-YIG domain-containing protein n=1 Tax=Rubripirellula amarantea TaxID=2527999 RepID=A0A5C5WLS9_9BACT|nr:GIY-YIG nuclease family protein [Rubripirellula amarantea]TWT51089.1 hypothetical protein Pla22_38660 [Rubripirellula amarantea]